MKLVNWKSYYRDEQLFDYNLKDYKDNNIEIKLFNTNDENMKGDHQINYLNKYLGELPMMYYIWKNNLKSEYIKISQYRRDITYINYRELNKNKIQLICQWDENNNIKLKDRILQYRDPSGYIKEALWKFIKKQYSLSDEQLENIQNKTSYRCMAVFVWAMNWDTYCKLCEFIFGFLDVLFPNEGWKNIDTIINFRDNQKELYYKKYEKSNDWVYYDSRYLTFIVEDILSVILGQFFDIFGNNKYWDETYIITEVNKDTNVFNIIRFYKLNMKCNPFRIYIKCLDNESYEYFHYFFIEENNWEYNTINIIKSDELYDERAIKLDINEYIDLNDPLDLYQNKYDIKNIGDYYCD